MKKLPRTFLNLPFTFSTFPRSRSLKHPLCMLQQTPSESSGVALIEYILNNTNIKNTRFFFTILKFYVVMENHASYNLYLFFTVDTHISRIFCEEEDIAMSTSKLKLNARKLCELCVSSTARFWVKEYFIISHLSSTILLIIKLFLKKANAFVVYLCIRIRCSNA